MLTWQNFIDSPLGGTRLYCMIALILAGAAFDAVDGLHRVAATPRRMDHQLANCRRWRCDQRTDGVLIVLGCFLDGISMVVLTMGVLLPDSGGALFDLLWFGIFVVLVVEMAQITPPVGFNLFVLQGIPDEERNLRRNRRFRCLS